jgi:hypothetical protein
VRDGIKLTRKKRMKQKGALGGETKAERVEESRRGGTVVLCFQKFSGWVSTMIQQLPPVGQAT